MAVSSIPFLGLLLEEMISQGMLSSTCSFWRCELLISVIFQYIVLYKMTIHIHGRKYILYIYIYTYDAFYIYNLHFHLRKNETDMTYL